jgi:hypothetical protein
MRMMGADSVAYHEKTVMRRADDFPGRALAYYASRGETPLVWGGAGAERLGLVDRVTEAQYAAIYGPGGACDPTTGERLASTTRPGMELVIAAHKSVAELGVIGRAEDMHRIMDAERDATLSYLEAVTQTRGGRRGRQRTATATSGLVYAHTRHATSRAGDPSPHDHVLVANVVDMLDPEGGWKALTARLSPPKHGASTRPSAGSRRNETNSRPPAEHATPGWLTTPRPPDGSAPSNENSTRRPNSRASLASSAELGPSASAATSAPRRQAAASKSTSVREDGTPARPPTPT